jgi:threonine/homoserine/homoserine lactone efflux protein
MNGGAAAWSTLFLLGAYHGINPGMGWLFAVARGMQEHRARAVAWSLPPIALGHALSIGVVVLIAGFAQIALQANS